jgi:hypothetical protein
MRLERLICRVCDAMVLVLVCLGFLLGSSSGLAHVIPDASQCTVCPGAGVQCLGLPLTCTKGTGKVPCGTTNCVCTALSGDGYFCMYVGP